MKKAVIFGAGNVGRGFIGQLVFEAGMDVTFIDMAEPIITSINLNHSYPHFTISSQGKVQKDIEHVKAVNALDTKAVISEIVAADILATAVGANALPKIASLLAQGIEARIKDHKPPVNILLCENLHNAASLMRDWLIPHLTIASEKKFDEQVGLLTTSIGRMIPAPTQEMTAVHPAAIQVEPYKFLPYDVSAAKGVMPDIPNLIGNPDVPFEFYADRKLYIHNMGHAICAYLSRLLDYTYIWEGIANPGIRYFVRSAMIESGLALAQKYQQPVQPIISHINDLLFRFSNRGLGDTIERVGRDPRRKLAKGDRLLGAYSLCGECACERNHISIGLAAGLLYLGETDGFSKEMAYTDFLQSQDLLLTDEPDARLLISQMQALRNGFDFTEQISLIDQRYKEADII